MVGSKLDRANRSKLQYGLTNPDASTRGNVYINNSDKSVWINVSNTWVCVARPSVVFCQTSNVVAPGSENNTLLSGNTGTKVISANSLSVGQTIHLEAYGYFDIATQDSLDLKSLSLKFNSSHVYEFGGWNVASDTGWHIKADVTIRSIGATGSSYTQGLFILDGSDCNVSESSSVVTVDTTVDITLDLLAEITTESSSMVCTNCTIQVLNPNN